MKDRYVFPAVFERGESGCVVVNFPDVQGCCTQGKDDEEATFMARSVLGLRLSLMEDDQEDIPVPSRIADLKLDPGTYIAMIDVYMPFYRNSLDERVEKVYCTIPQKYKRLGIEHNINFSQVLTNALKNKFDPMYLYNQAERKT